MVRQAMTRREHRTGLEDLTEEQRRHVEHIDAGGDGAMEGTRYKLKIKQPLVKVVPIRMSDEQWRVLTREAEELGLRPTTLLRMWVLERLRTAERSHQGGAVATAV